MTRANFGDSVDATVRKSDIDGFTISGHCRVVCKDSSGQVKWVDEGKNIVVNTGLDYMLGTAVVDSATIYVGLTTGSPSPSASDTMSSHSGWAEAAGYTSSTRVAWGQDAASNQAVTNSTAVSFTMNGDDTSIGGAFLTTDSTKDGTTGTLIAVKAFSGGNRTVANNDTLDVTYTISGSSS
jgi:hypothetical protein